MLQYIYFETCRCSTSESRVAAYELMTELAKGSLNILKDISKQLVQMHHLPQPDSANEWDVGSI